MIINLSPKAHGVAVEQAKKENQATQQFVEELIEKLLQANSCYMILSPIPPEDKLKAISTFIDAILNGKPFFGFKMLTEEEASEAYNSIMAQTVPEEQDQIEEEKQKGIHVV